MPGQAEQVSLATRDDGAELCRLFKETAMVAEPQLLVERDPDFFALYDLQKADSRTWVLRSEPDGPIDGMGTVLVRDGWLDGDRIRVGYLGDLRLRRRVRGGRFLGRHFGPILTETRRELGCEVLLTSIIDSNKAARWALARSQKQRPDQPVYRPILSFDIANLHFTFKPRPSRRVRVRQATVEDLPAIGAALSADHRQRAFGYDIDAAEVGRRIRDWPGLDVESFLVAEDRRGALIGSLAVWDAHQVKRFRVTRWGPAMERMRRFSNLLSLVSGSGRLPASGGLLRYAYLCQVSVRDQDPVTLRALVDEARRRCHDLGFHFLTTQIVPGRPLASAFSGLRMTRLPATLYAVSAAGSRFNGIELDGRAVGFEMALV